MRTAKFVNEISVIDPDTNGNVLLTIFKHENGGMFGIDVSFFEQYEDDGNYITISDPFEVNSKVALLRLDEDL